MGPRSVGFAHVLWIAVAIGCASDPSGPTGTGTCSTSAECFNGYLCMDGRCRRVGDAGPPGADLGTPPGADLGVLPPVPPPIDAGADDSAAPPPLDGGPPIDSGGSTSDGSVSLPDMFDPDAPVRCGAMDQPCCGMSGLCNAGLACVGAVCRPRAECGGASEPCCTTGAACEMGLTCTDGSCLSCVPSMTMPGVTGMFFDSCGFGACMSAITITGSGTTITFTGGGGSGGPLGGGMGMLTLSGGVTASGTFTTTCSPAFRTCDFDSVMGTAAGLVFTDRTGASGTITLSGATASGTASFPCTGDSCSSLFYITAEGTTISFQDTLGLMQSITLSPATICE